MAGNETGENTIGIHLEFVVWELEFHWRFKSPMLCEYSFTASVLLGAAGLEC